MTKLDRLRQGFFSLVFGLFVFLTVKYSDYIPNPHDINENDRKRWLAAGVQYDQLRDGDLILRHGRGFISDAMLAFSTKDPRYSHSGIIKKENGKVYVYHTIGGEENEVNLMRKEHISIFCHPRAIFGFGIYRYDLEKQQLNSLDSILGSWYDAKMEFDMDFEMETDDKMYCSEMIYKSLILATNDENYVPLSDVLDKPYVAIDDLYLNNHCTIIFEYDYD